MMIISKLKYIIIFSIGLLSLVGCNKEVQLHSSSEQTNIDNFGDLYTDFRIAKKKVALKVPIIEQYPELPRGCEVTSLAMLLQYYNITADKMKLANEIQKEPFQVLLDNGKTLNGNPHNGYVGNMYTKAQPGFGVYIEPITDLAKKYSPGYTIVNLKDSRQMDFMFLLSEGSPIWMITTSTFKVLPSTSFEVWNTLDGPVKITYSEHSVVLTGYDENYFYFNDPLSSTPNKKAPKQEFYDAWVQMGRQAFALKSN